MKTWTCAILTLGLAIFTCTGCGQDSGKPKATKTTTGGRAPVTKPSDGAQDGPTVGGLATPESVEPAVPATEGSKSGAEEKATEEKKPAVEDKPSEEKQSTEEAKPTEQKKSDEKKPE
jgi:hypothetical protein